MAETHLKSERVITVDCSDFLRGLELELLGSLKFAEESAKLSGRIRIKT